MDYIFGGVPSLTSIPVRSHSDLQNLNNNDHPWYSAEPNRIVLTSFTKGLDASKTATPAVGSVYYATDSTKLYEAFTLNTWTQVSDIAIPAGAAQGDTIYFNGTNWARLTAGTSGQVLATGGAGANPSCASPATAYTFSGTIIDFASNTNVNTFMSFTIPANVLGTSNGVWYRLWFSKFDLQTTVTNTHTLNIGGTQIIQWTTAELVSYTNGMNIDIYVFANGATNSQNVYISYHGIDGSVAWGQENISTSSFDSTTSQSITYTIKPNTSNGKHYTLNAASGFIL